MAEELKPANLIKDTLASKLEKHKEQDGGLWDTGVPLHRTNAVPLDASSVLLDITAEEYAETNPTAYPGQLIVKVEADGATGYIVQTPSHTHQIARVNSHGDPESETTESAIVEQIALKSELDYWLNTLTGKIGNLTQIMNFRGAFETFAKAEEYAKNSAFRPGDVIVITGTDTSTGAGVTPNKPGMEYVYTEDNEWVELGFGTQVAKFIGGDGGLVMPTTLPDGTTTSATTLVEYIQKSDKNLQDALNSEKAVRAQADTELNQRIDNLILDTENVLMAKDLKFTVNFGRYTTSNNKPYTISKYKNGADDTEGIKSLHDLFIDAFSQVLYPKTNYPTASFSANGHTTDTGTNEIGSYVKAIKWTSSSGNGSYVGADGTGTYGSSGGTSNASGISSSNFSWVVSNNKDAQTSTGSSGTFTFTETTYKDSTKGLQINSTSSKTYATLNCTTTLDPSKAYTPKDNTGELYETGKIKGFDAASTKTKTFKDVAINVTGFRNSWYYVGTDCTTEINSAFIRKARAKNANTTNFGTITIPAGTKRVMIAIPGSHTLNSVIDIDGQNLDVKANFTAETIAVEGANGYTATNYTVFHFENENGIAATKYTFSIS